MRDVMIPKAHSMISSQYFFFFKVQSKKSTNQKQSKAGFMRMSSVTEQYNEKQRTELIHTNFPSEIH